MREMPGRNVIGATVRNGTGTKARLVTLRTSENQDPSLSPAVPVLDFTAKTEEPSNPLGAYSHQACHSYHHPPSTSSYSAVLAVL